MTDPVTPPSGRTGPGETHHAQSHGSKSSPTSEQQRYTDTGTYLNSISELAGRSFASTSEAIEVILYLVIDQLSLRSSFLTRISCERGLRSNAIAN